MVATGGGSIEFPSGPALTIIGASGADARPNVGRLILGPSFSNYDLRAVNFTGSTTFGLGFSVLGSSGSGPVVGVQTSAGLLTVPVGYSSGDVLATSTGTWVGATFVSLGMTPGSYVWTLNGQAPDTFTINIGPVDTSVPEPGSMIMTLGGLGLVSLVIRTRKRKAHRLKQSF